MERVPGTRWPLVGREAELEVFGSRWQDHRCRSVVIFGPAGVGKSRLAEELLARATGRGWKGVRATATATASSVPLSTLAHLIPAGADLSDPVRGFAAVARALAGPRRNRRWTVLVDDLHLLDAASAVLLRQLLDAGVVRLIGTVRTHEPVGDAVRALTGGDAECRIDLAPFDPQGTEAALGAALGGPVDQRTLHTLHDASGGNPLYLRELVVGALTAGTLTGDGEIWQLAEGELATTPRLSELIHARLAAADPAAGPVLELLALCESLPLADAQDVCGHEVVAGIEDVGLVRILTDGRRTTLTLAHPLYREVLRAGLPAARRRTLLLAQADRTRARGGRRREDALHLATCQLAATGTADPVLLLRAAALARHAHDYRQAIGLLDTLPESARTHASCMLHGDVLLQSGQWQQADELLSQAQDRASGESEQIAAALLRSWNLMWMPVRADEALRVIEEARGRVTDPAGLRLLAVNEGALRVVSGQPVRGLALLEDLETDVRQTPDASSWVVAAASRTSGLALVGRIDEAVRWGRHAHDVHAQVEEEVRGAAHPTRQLVPLVYALAEGGRLAEARTVADRAFRDLGAAGAHPTSPWVAHFRGRVEWLAGDAAAARRWHGEAIAQARVQRQTRPLFHAWAGLAAAAAVLGDLDAAEGALVEMKALAFTGFYAVAEEELGRAWLCAARGDPAQARAVLTAAADDARDTGHLTSEMLLLTDVARLGGAEDVADRLADLARSCDGTLAPARAHLAAALADGGPEQLQAAAGELQAVGAHLLAAEAAGAAVIAWQRAGHTRRATASARQARISADLCPGVRTPLLAAAGTTSPLTRRQREIALLAADGLPSKEIADTLHLSVRTVDNHLQSAYAKLGVTTRRGLVAALGMSPF